MPIGSRPETARADALSNRGIGEDAHGDPAIKRDDMVHLLGCHPQRQTALVDIDGV